MARMEICSHKTNRRNKSAPGGKGGGSTGFTEVFFVFAGIQRDALYVLIQAFLLLWLCC